MEYMEHVSISIFYKSIFREDFANTNGNKPWTKIGNDVNLCGLVVKFQGISPRKLVEFHEISPIVGISSGDF